MSRTMRVPYRIAATSLAALVVLLGPAAWPAYAGGSTPVGDPPVGPSVWEPPPLPADAPLPNNVGQAGSPDNNYTQGQNAACIKSGVMSR